MSIAALVVDEIQQRVTWMRDVQRNPVDGVPVMGGPGVLRLMFQIVDDLCDCCHVDGECLDCGDPVRLRWDLPPMSEGELDDFVRYG